ncbi:DNA polymerase III subunit delta [Pseudoblastomonas halimionae]|uniref:DNA-directed DNA polymerase n=1 Tax=Alteriqipengyuania halimionae TaxID=1926630 RepID=A0A6I4U8A0_9SPHN|nr:DNA polymerase III subunit delta [Alteriqipengyuania halimionae]MXP10692.1 DNA polymerase III subunit delta [Alteriqipengyuania halimionae]
MKVKSGEFARRAPQLARDCRLFFLCGPDEGGASAAADKLIAALPDPGERIEFSGSEVKSDPVKVADEAVSSSLFGGSRHLYLRVSGEEAKDALALLVEQGEEAAPVIVVARSASDKSRSAKLLEKRADAVVAMFYPPDLRSLAGEVRQMADAAGLRLPTALAERIASGVRLDARLAKSEVDKLSLYLDASPQSPKSVDESDYDAVCASSEDDGFNPLVAAVLSGKTDRLAHELERYRHTGMNAVGVLLAFERRVAQLAQLASRLGPRQSIPAFIEDESRARRVFWKDKGELTDQLSRWRGPALERLVERMVELHQQILARSQDGDLLLAQELTQIARYAARGK